MTSLFDREPESVVDGIPIFAQRDEYVLNYETIAAGHLAAEGATGENPFIEERRWRDSEASTRDLLRRYSKAGDRVLDIGVGLGRLLAPFPDLERHGVDISLDYLRRASRQGIDVAMARVEDLPYPPDTFDLVLATDVLEHVLDLNEAVRAMLGVLRPGGILIVRSPNREDLTGYLRPDYPYRYVHLRTFDRASFVLLFDRVFGCDVLDVVEAGYSASPSHFRWVLPLPKWRSGVSFLIFGPISRIHPRLARAVLPRFYDPYEINIVVRKPHPASG
jgi:SAM-dependent methyltransferase